MSYESKDQIFLYHAYALGLGGYVERNNQQLAIPSIGSAALAMAGGMACSDSGFFEWAPPCEPAPPKGFYISVGSVSAKLWSQEEDDYWTTNAEVRVSNFNLCERVKIGLMVNRLTSKHKKRACKTFQRGRDDQPRISFKDSQFWNVTVDGEGVDVGINRDLDQHQSHDELKQAIAADRPPKGYGAFCARNLLAAEDEAPEYVRDLARKYTSDRLTRCSIVGEVKKSERLPHAVHGYSMELEDFGRVFFGEMIVADGMKRLNMIRWDLGCDNCGGGGGGSSDMNGMPSP